MQKIAVFLFFFLFFLAESRPAELVFVTTEWPPFEYTDNGIESGSDVEIVKAVFQEMGISIDIRFYPWKRCIAMAQNNEVDGIFTLRKTPERESFLVFTTENISLSENVFFIKKGSHHTFNSLADLKDLTIGITAGYEYGDEFMTSSMFTRDEAITDEAGFKKVASGRINMFICDKLVGIYELKKSNLSGDITYLPRSYSEFQMFLAFTKKHEESDLTFRFDKALKKIKTNGAYKKIISKYLQ